LVWNLCKESVVKQTSVAENMLKHSGPAKVFYTEQDLINAVSNWEIQEWDVVVLPFQWPAWAPWMPEMLMPTAVLKWAGFQKVALITDWRFSWWTSGPCVWHIFPEAYKWWRIWLIRNWDIIHIDIPKRILSVEVSEEMFTKRSQEEQIIPQRVLTPLLQKFRQFYLE